MAKTPDNVNLKVKLVKRPGKRRVATGWTLLLLGLLVAGVWVASRWWAVQYASSDSLVIIVQGRCRVWSMEPGPSGPFQWSAGAVSPADQRWEWWSSSGQSSSVMTWGFYSRDRNPRRAGVTHLIVLWPIPLLLWTPGALLLRSGIFARRRAVKGMCAKGGCGYSLAGLAPDAPCPECGPMK